MVPTAPLQPAKYILVRDTHGRSDTDTSRVPPAERHIMGDFFNWLFATRTGVMALIGGGIVLFLIIAFVLERRGRKLYYNHERVEGEEESFLESIFDDGE